MGNAGKYTSPMDPHGEKPRMKLIKHGLFRRKHGLFRRNCFGAMDTLSLVKRVKKVHPRSIHIVDGTNPAPVVYPMKKHRLIHPRWLFRISSINSMYFKLCSSTHQL